MATFRECENCAHDHTSSKKQPCIECRGFSKWELEVPGQNKNKPIGESLMADKYKGCETCGVPDSTGVCHSIDGCDDNNNRWIPRHHPEPKNRVAYEDITPLKIKSNIDPKYRKLTVYAVCIIVCAGCGYTMPIEHYKIFLEAFTFITCGFFVGNAAGKFGKVK